MLYPRAERQHTQPVGKDIFGGDSDLEDEEDKGQGCSAEVSSQLVSPEFCGGGTQCGGERGTSEREGVEESQMMDGNGKEEEKRVDPFEVAMEEFLMMFGSSR